MIQQKSISNLGPRKFSLVEKQKFTKPIFHGRYTNVPQQYNMMVL